MLPLLLHHNNFIVQQSQWHLNMASLLMVT